MNHDTDRTHCGDEITLCEVCGERVCDDCGKPRSTCVDLITCEDCALECAECAQDVADDLAAEAHHDRMRGLTA